MRVLLWRVARPITPDDATPSVRRRYGAFDPTPGGSAPVPRLGTLILAELLGLNFSLCIGATGSYVPYQRQSRAHAAFMPDAGGAVHRVSSPPSSRDTDLDPGFDVMD